VAPSRLPRRSCAPAARAPLPCCAVPGSFGSLSRSYGSGAGSYGARGAAIAEDEELLEQDAELLLMLNGRTAPLGKASAHMERRASAASFDDDEDDGAREDSPGAPALLGRPGGRACAAPPRCSHAHCAVLPC
jgi:hypothetical protein